MLISKLAKPVRATPLILVFPKDVWITLKQSFSAIFSALFEITVSTLFGDELATSSITPEVLSSFFPNVLPRNTRFFVFSIWLIGEACFSMSNI